MCVNAAFDDSLDFGNHMSSSNTLVQVRKYFVQNLASEEHFVLPWLSDLFFFNFVMCRLRPLCRRLFLQKQVSVFFSLGLWCARFVVCRFRPMCRFWKKGIGFSSILRRAVFYAYMYVRLKTDIGFVSCFVMCCFRPICLEWLSLLNLKQHNWISSYLNCSIHIYCSI